MEDTQKVYESLAAHLDRLPSGFPRTPTGVELRILRRLFTPEEAALAQCLAMKPEPAATIAARASESVEELAPRLEAMSRKGLIFRIRKGPETRYMAAQFVIGIWEYHVNDLDPELIRDANEYLPYFFKESYQLKTPQLRTIPVSRALPSEQPIMAYEEARKIVLEQEKILVAPCICRKEQSIAGKGCDRPMESCLVFGIGARYYEDNGLGRVIDHEEALQILERAEKTGLVLQPSNAQKVVNICTCCGCCCQVLKNLKKLPKPAQYVSSNYFAAIDATRCTGCEECLERCQMNAIKVEERAAAILRDQCIGCGLCVTTCPEKALRLEAKSEQDRSIPPKHYSDTLMKIARERMARLKAAMKGQADA